MNCVGAGQVSVADSYEHCNELSGYAQDGKLHVKLSSSYRFSSRTQSNWNSKRRFVAVLSMHHIYMNEANTLLC
jgi:hypothetical protein